MHFGVSSSYKIHTKILLTSASESLLAQLVCISHYNLLCAFLAPSAIIKAQFDTPYQKKEKKSTINAAWLTNHHFLYVPMAHVEEYAAKNKAHVCVRGTFGYTGSLACHKQQSLIRPDKQWGMDNRPCSDDQRTIRILPDRNTVRTERDVCVLWSAGERKGGRPSTVLG